MRFISVDIEAEQPSGEIIQIGAVAFDTDKGIIAEFNRYIYLDHPIAWDYVLDSDKDSKKTLGDLLPYGQDKIDAEGINKQQALAEFWSWFFNVNCSRRAVQWGRGDIRCMLEQTNAENKPNKRIEVIDAKILYKNMYQPAMKLPKRYGLRGAVESLLSSFVGKQHDAYDDAYNTALVYQEMFKVLEMAREIKKLVK